LSLQLSPNWRHCPSDALNGQRLAFTSNPRSARRNREVAEQAANPSAITRCHSNSCGVVGPREGAASAPPGNAGWPPSRMQRFPFRQRSRKPLPAFAHEDVARDRRRVNHATPPSSAVLDESTQATLGLRFRCIDRLECRELLGWDKQRDAAGLTGVPLDEAAVVQGHDHPMNGGWRDAEEVPKVALSRRSAVESGVGVDERQILALERGESDHAVCCGGPRCPTIPRWVAALR